MAIKLQCPHCGVRISFQDKLYGKKVTCPKCNKKFDALTETDKKAKQERERILAEEDAKQRKRLELERLRKKQLREERKKEHHEYKAQIRAAKATPPEYVCPYCGNENIENLYVKSGSKIGTEQALGCLAALLLCGLTLLFLGPLSLFIIPVIAVVFVIGFIVQSVSREFHRNKYICPRCGNQFKL